MHILQNPTMHKEFLVCSCVNITAMITPWNGEYSSFIFVHMPYRYADIRSHTVTQMLWYMLNRFGISTPVIRVWLHICGTHKTSWKGSAYVSKTERWVSADSSTCKAKPWLLLIHVINSHLILQLASSIPIESEELQSGTFYNLHMFITKHIQNYAFHAKYDDIYGNCMGIIAKCNMTAHFVWCFTHFHFHLQRLMSD